MNARFYVPYLNRFLTADTIVPDPTNPQQFNRYTYVLGNPLRLVDPTGHWSCSGRDNCEVTVQTWLNLLDEAGELGQSLADFFRDSTIEVKFLDIENLVMSADNLKNQINVGIQKMEEKFANEGSDGWLILFTQFGHEVEHMRQGFVQANSIQGEYLGYHTQIELGKNWDANHNTTIVTDMLIGKGSSRGSIYLGFLSDWETSGANLDPNSHADMEYFYKHNLAEANSVQYASVPIFPWPKEVGWQVSLSAQNSFDRGFGWLYDLAYYTP